MYPLGGWGVITGRMTQLLSRGAYERSHSHYYSEILVPQENMIPEYTRYAFQCELEQPTGNQFFQELAKVFLNPKLCFITGKIEMVKSKWGLAFSAVICVIASLIMASGLCSFFGLVTTLDSR